MSISKQAEQIREISGVNPYKCMKCGKCSASCPSFNEMDIKPHQFVSYVLNDDIESLVNSKSLWKCLSCFACIEPGAFGSGSAPAAPCERVQKIQEVIACRELVYLCAIAAATSQLR